MNTATSIIIGAAILASSYIYTNRYQKVGVCWEDVPVYKDMISGQLLVTMPEKYSSKLQELKMKFISFE